MAPHSSTLAWKIPWTEEPGRLQSMGSLRVRHHWATSLSLFTFMHWRRKWQPTPVFLPGESQGQGAWWATVYGVAQSQTRLKRLSSSSSSSRPSEIFREHILNWTYHLITIWPFFFTYFRLWFIFKKLLTPLLSIFPLFIQSLHNKCSIFACKTAYLYAFWKMN